MGGGGRREKGEGEGGLTTKSLVGLVVKASSSRAADPGFDSRCNRGYFSQVESYQ